MAKTARVLLTLFEDPVEVPEAEVEVLRHQGLLREVLANGKPAKPAPEPSSPDTSKEGVT